MARQHMEGDAQGELADFGLGPYVHGTPSRRFPVYTRGNAGEVYPQPVFPLTSAMAKALAGDSTGDFLRSTGMLTDAECDEDADVFMGVFGGYTYINLSVTRVVAIRTPGTSLDDADAPFLGAEGLAPEHVADRRDRNWSATVRGLRYGWRVLANPDLPALDDAAAEIATWRAGLTPIGEASDDELFDETAQMLPMISRIFALHLSITGGTGIGLDALRRTAGRHGEDLMVLLGGLGDVDSAVPSDALWDLGRLVRGDPRLTAHFDEGLDGLETRLLGDAAAVDFLAAFNGFLARHGARGPNEWEMGCDVWGTKPALPLALIDRIRHADNDHSPGVRGARRATDREDAVAAARRRVRRHERWLFDRGLRCTVVRTRGRERCKTILVEAIHEGRLRLRELGRRLAERHPGVAHDDLFFVTLDEAPAYRAEPESFVDVVSARRAIRNQLEALEPPFSFTGRLPPTDTWRRRADATTVEVLAPGTILTGTGGSPGVARGRARVVTDPSDPGDLGPGDVLVAPLTDPSWTPLFVPVEAVVVDVGGQMSHAVIVSRELGLPCVVAATGATTAILDGTLIEVDGAAGTIRILGDD
ncbi:MAG TPA: PEP-utilizing enzyme [Acidimicrobiales bacterium]|nr:PEP-utilizing enzyme [Acidimicrobiales bacterium]